MKCTEQSEIARHNPVQPSRAIDPLEQGKAGEQGLMVNELKIAAEKFGVLDRVPMGVCVLREDYVVLFWNRCLEDWTHLERTQIVGTNICQYFPHLSQPNYASRLQQIFAGGPPTIFSSQLHKHVIPALLPDARLRIQHTTVTAEPAADGERYYALLSIQDVTELTQRVQDYRTMRDQALAEVKERQRTEEALRSREHQLRTLINAMPDLVCFKDAEGRWIEANDTTLKVFQLEGVDYRGKTNTELAQLSPFLRDSFFEGEQTDEAMWSRGKVWSGEQVVPLRDGGAKTYETIKVPLYYADGQRRGIVILRRDMTERKQAEEEIRNALAKEKELSELQSRFVSIMSHEFRTPLTTVLSSAELIENYSYKWTEEKKLTHIHRIQNSVNHLVQLLEDVTIIGKAEAGKLEFKSEPIDLLQFCLHLVEEMELGAGSQHTIAFTSVGQCTNACMDEKLLRHIFTNLLSNAIKYSPQGGTVDFELACRDGQAIFQIKDSGLGIPKEDQEKLFESFYRAKNVGTISGTGLGLAIVKRSVDIHAGQITVESEVGVGTVFTVTLPLNSTELETRS